MPLYEYECENDGHRFEVIQKFSDAPLTTCPECGGKVRRLISSPAIQFKGSGWYITDYARKGGQGGTNGGSSGSKSSPASSGSSSSSDSSSGSASSSGGDSSSSGSSGDSGSSAQKS